MDIQFTEEQELLRSSVQRLLRDQYGFEARRKIVASEEGFSRKQWEAFAELGLLAAPFSEDVGGLGKQIKHAIQTGKTVLQPRCATR